MEVLLVVSGFFRKETLNLKAPPLLHVQEDHGTITLMNNSVWKVWISEVFEVS